ncbi:glutathione S-transferase [Gemmobacter megaterium]|uniref:Glutathione S-transferase n=1 Tax=Gemmobacter megaterium TaxID=1086013 RepID=A0A1N7MK66_9RHOB|nr:glutathione S-transferase family protein [Gemmobacter megaterium]GGE06334.1 glutathione S-transferase [Gemmobacter megaterium]SIS86503.1 glutathione S-transferase [Gemmobacter megaterium]
MTDLTFWTSPRSRGAIVRWMLEEVGAPYTTIMLDYGAPMKTPEYLAINPMGKVPAIRHLGQVVTECAAICAYLADAFPLAGLAPPAPDRAAYYRWLFFGAGPVEAAATNAALGVVVPEDRRSMVGYGDARSVIAAVEQRLDASAYLAGDSFSAADVYTGSQIGWGLKFGTVPDRPIFRDYWARLSARPAHARATELDAALSGGAA